MPVQPDAEEQRDGQHRQPGVAPQLDVVVEHPRPEGEGAGSRLHLDVDQGHQVGHARAGRRRRAAAAAGPPGRAAASRPAAVPGTAPCPASRCRRTRTAPPSRGRSKEEGLEELLEQHLEALVVIRAGGLRHDRLPVEPDPEGRDRRPTRKPFGSEATAPCYQDDRFLAALVPLRGCHHRGHRRRHDGSARPWGKRRPCSSSVTDGRSR